MLRMSVLETRKIGGGGGVVSFRRFALVLFIAFALPPLALAGQIVISDNQIINGIVYGRYVYNANADSVAATGSSVTINGGTVNGSNVYGGYAQSDDGSATATGNSVTINGGMVNSYVSGGYSRSSTVATSAGNSVTINGGTVAEDSVFGGNAYSSTVDSNVIGGRVHATSGTAIGNSVTINGGEIRAF